MSTNFVCLENLKTDNIPDSRSSSISTIHLSDDEGCKTPTNFNDDIFEPSSTDKESSTYSSDRSQVTNYEGSYRENLGSTIPPPASIISDYLGNPRNVASTNFSTLINNITTSLNSNLSTDAPPTYEFRQKNPYLLNNDKYLSNNNNSDECSLLKYTSFPLCYSPAVIPQLNLSSIVKPSEVLDTLTSNEGIKNDKIVKGNFNSKKIAWPEDEKNKYPSTARDLSFSYYYNNEENNSDSIFVKIVPKLGPLKEKDEEVPSFDEDDFDISNIPTAIIKSRSAPTTQRVKITRRAPCAIAYPNTSAFIGIVTNMESGGDWEHDLYEGCCTDDETALHCAAARGHLECVQSLLDCGAPVDGRDQTGQTALHLALRRSHIDIALLLITKGCNLDIQDENGDSPLHVACRLGLISAVQTLCHIGASVDLRNIHSLTPLHIAAKEGDIEIIRCLILAGADVNCLTKNGETAESIALLQDNLPISSLLAKMKSTSNKNLYIDQLIPHEGSLKRIKLKLFGHSGSGKTKLISAWSNSGVINQFLGAVSKKFSDNISLSPHSSNSTSTSIGAISFNSSEEGYHSCASSTSSSMSEALHNNNFQKCQDSTNINGSNSNNVNNNNTSPVYFNQPAHPNYTRGIDVQNVNINGAGEFSIWEFGGYEPYHIAYDHFVGNTDCIHAVIFNSQDPTEIQYKQVLYWMNFLKGRVTPSEPIGHCGIVSRRSKVVIVGTNASNSQFTKKNSNGEYMSSDLDAMLKTVRLRFETHFDIHESIILLDSNNNNCSGMRALKNYLRTSREFILNRLQRPLSLLDTCLSHLTTMRKHYENFPVISWPHFTAIIRNELNPLASDSHSRQLIQQLQLIGEVVYLRDESTELDYVVLNPEWLGTHIIGMLLSAEYLGKCRQTGIYSIDDFAPLYPEIGDINDLLHILDTLQLCSPTEGNNPESEFEFPAFILKETPKDCWKNDKKNYVYGGMKILPMRGMERSLQSTFPRIQTALRRSMHDFQDPMDADLTQWTSCSKLCSGAMESLIRLKGDAVEILVRGPSEMAASCFYFMEDIANMVEHTASEVAPGISLERHFFSPKHLKDHRPNPAIFPPEVIMAMQQKEQMVIKNSDDEEENFIDVVCFGSREVASVLTLGIDVGVAQLQMASRCELAALLDPSDAMGRDWSILAVKLNLTDQLPEVDSTGQSLSRTDQLLAEWALQCPENATVGQLCSILEELGRKDAKDALYRTVPLYIFAPLEDGTGIGMETLIEGDCNDSGVYPHVNV
ncbi:Bent [Strongyloides ratti]|uniref:Bent n=1 Tax=Strongyloides ratti TaxID=34506 RepID=A0A090MX84_STRRB|nr:Bent [Strongyloides ratti]CEF64989.1 Bent [Strongyloides ratti]